MRKDDGIPVVVLDLPEYLLTLFRREVFASRIKDLGHRICRAESFGNLVNIGFESRNHGLVCQSETFLFVGCAAHDQRLAASDLVINDTAAQQDIHPDGILLTGIEVFDTQRLAVEAGKGQVRAVILRAHEAVELAVVGVGQPLFELRSLVVQPLRESAADFVDPGIGELDFLSVADLHILPLAINEFTNFLGDVGRGVVQCMLHQVQSAVMAELAVDGILLPDFDVVRACGREAVLVDIGGIADLHLRLEEP